MRFGLGLTWVGVGYVYMWGVWGGMGVRMVEQQVVGQVNSWLGYWDEMPN